MIEKSQLAVTKINIIFLIFAFEYNLPLSEHVNNFSLKHILSYNNKTFYQPATLSWYLKDLKSHYFGFTDIKSWHAYLYIVNTT